MDRMILIAKRVFVVVGLILLVLLVMDFNSRMAELSRLTSQRERMGVQLTDLVETQVYVDTQIAYATSDAAVEAWAREEARWVQQGDYPIIPIAPDGVTPEPVMAVTPTPQPLSNWEVWLQWLSGSTP
jgi:hypothetical protein